MLQIIPPSTSGMLIAEILYVVFIILVCLRIIYDTRSSTKASAYILLVIFLPLIGVFIYFSVGINYRKRKLYSKNLFAGELKNQMLDFIQKDRDRIIDAGTATLLKYSGLVDLVLKQKFSPLSDDNVIEVLHNGENKFPAVIKAIEEAQHHIHLEYYIFETDEIGMTLIELLIQKANEGLEVRFIFDDFGSKKMRKQVKRMRQAGIEIFPFYEIKWLMLANRMNYRNHRKIIVIDGQLGFIGGINVCDKYINHASHPQQWYWRDTHLKILGSTVQSLQYVFMVDWNFCSRQKLEPHPHFFPEQIPPSSGKTIAQVVVSGPDSDAPYILLSLCKAISLAQKEVLITNPYFIPSTTLLDTILITALSGVQVKLLVPGVSDSAIVNIANHSHFGELLKAGVEIYTYNKGFIHAKTMVIDRELAIVGTANMDFRSFDLNFEINTIVYDKEIAQQLSTAFYDDLEHSSPVDAVEWNKRPLYRQLLDRIVRLVSPLM